MNTQALKGTVHTDPEIMGGVPVFVGTRVPVESLFDHLKAGDSIEVEFQVPSRLRVACIIRNRAGYCFGLEFLAVLPS